MRVLDRIRTFKDTMLSGQKRQVQQDDTYDDAVAYIPDRNNQYVDVEYEEDDQIAFSDDKLTTEEILESYGVKSVARFDTFWRRFLEFVVIIGEFALLVLLGYCNGAFFAVLKPIGYSEFVNFLYFIGFIIELGTMAFVITSALALRDGNKRRAITVGVFAIIGLIVSVACQIGFVFLNAAQNEFDMFTLIAIRMQAPIPVNFILLGRAIIPSIFVVGFAFILPEKTNDIDGAIAKQSKESEAVGKLQLNQALMEQRQIAFDTATRLLMQSSKQLEYVSDTLSRGHNASVEQARPKLTIEHVAQEEIAAPERKSAPSRALQTRTQQRSSPKPIPMQKQQLPDEAQEEKKSASVQKQKVREEDVKKYLRRILKQVPGVSVEEIRKAAPQFGVSPDMAEMCYYQVKEEMKQAQPVPVTANGNGASLSRQSLRRDYLTQVPTSRIHTGDVDMSDVDGDVQNPLAE